MGYRLLFFIALIGMMSCKTADEKADLVIVNADVYTVDDKNPSASYVVVTDGKITALGSDETYKKYVTDSTEIIDAGGAFVMPGFIEGHGHFASLGRSVQNLNFIKAPSWQSIVEDVRTKVSSTPSGTWIVGRGWHQEKWNRVPLFIHEGYPTHVTLSAVSSENPVLLNHASGHSLFANQAAMDLAGVSIETVDPVGGKIVRDKDGKAIGVFEENAMGIIYKAYNKYLDSLDQEQLQAQWEEAISLAEKKCLENGITSFQDAGSSFKNIIDYTEMAKKGELDVRLWSMLRHSAAEMKDSIAQYKRYREGNNFFTCAAIKSELDGALGSYGAWLLKPYADKPGFVGQNTTTMLEVKNIADLAIENDMQLCVHAIGDRANRVVVDIYEGVLSKRVDGHKRRWRVEHAQHIDTVDIPRFRKNGIIASMQGIHCTSDAPFVEKRLGKDRAKNGSYAWRTFLDQGVIVANGTDAPIEDVNPLESFYASVTRKRADTGFEFFPEQAMTRAEAIHSYTLGNAYAAFEEDIKGSLEVGKLADIVILDKNLVQCTDDDILKTKVLYTIVDGKVKYASSKG